MNSNDLYEQICSFPDRYENRDLKEYLLALLKLVEQTKNQDLTPDLLLKLLQEAFTSQPAVFNSDWLKIIAAPDENIMSKKFTNPEISSIIDKSVISNKSNFDYTIAVIQFQIAELHKMRDKQLKDEGRYFGIDSETGNRWYNFDPFTNLECGARGLIDNAEDENEDMELTWQTLGELLEMGRIYE